MLLTIPTFDMRQTVIPLAEAPTMPCPDCEGQETLCGYGSGREPECEFGRVPFVGRIAIAVPCSQCSGVTRFAGDEYKCRTCWNNSCLIVASAVVEAVVPVWKCGRTLRGELHDPHRFTFQASDDSPERITTVCAGCGPIEIVAGEFALVLTDVQPTTERCPACWGVWSPCAVCFHDGGYVGGHGTCPPLPVAADPTWRKWPT